MAIEMVNRKWMKELGVEITRSNKAYEKYQTPDNVLQFVRVVNRTFVLGFHREEWLDLHRDINIFLFAEKIIPEVEKRLVLDGFSFWNESKNLFKWEKPEGQVMRYFTIEEVEQDLFSNPIKIEEIKGKFDGIPNGLKNSKMIFQERWPWELKQTFDCDDVYRLRARLAAQIIPKEAKLVEED